MIDKSCYPKKINKHIREDEIRLRDTNQVIYNYIFIASQALYKPLELIKDLEE